MCSVIPQDAGDHLKVQVGMDEASALEISAFGCACRGGNLEDAGMVWNGRLTADTRNSDDSCRTQKSEGALKAEAALPPLLTPVSSASFSHVLDFQLKLETPAQWI